MTEQEMKEELERLRETNAQLVERVKFVESEAKKAYEARDKAKQALVDGSATKELQKELENYKAKLAQVDEEKQALQKQYESETAFLKMTQQLSDLGIKTHNRDALETLAKTVLDDAVYEDGKFKFLSEDGTTRFNADNKEYDIIDKVNELRNSEKAYLFKEERGGGASGGNVPDAGKESLNDIVDQVLSYA